MQTYYRFNETEFFIPLTRMHCDFFLLFPFLDIEKQQKQFISLLLKLGGSNIFWKCKLSAESRIKKSFQNDDLSRNSVALALHISPLADPLQLPLTYPPPSFPLGTLFRKLLDLSLEKTLLFWKVSYNLAYFAKSFAFKRIA